MNLSLDLTPHASVKHWSAPLVGKSWATDFTCWDLVRTVQLGQFGRVMPAYDLADDRAPEQLRNVVHASGWKRIEDIPQEGDVLLVRGPDGLHVGVVIYLRGRAHLLHNLGGLDDAGVARGSVRIDPMADLGRLGYGRFELWRAAC